MPHATVNLLFPLIFSEGSVFLLFIVACCKQFKVHISNHILATIIQKLLTLRYTAKNVTFFVGELEKDLLIGSHSVVRGFCNNSVH